jgi:hypothetical protein
MNCDDAEACPTWRAGSPGLQRPLGPLVGALDPPDSLGPRPVATSGPGAVDTPASLEAAELAYARELTAMLVGEAAVRPVILAIELVHWADLTALAALEQFASC